jgi:hypothetical protein
METTERVRQELHELVLRYSGGGHPYNEKEINELLNRLQRAVMADYWRRS